MSGERILVVDDEENVLLTIQAILEMDGYAVDTCHSAAEAVAKIATTEYDVVLTDLRLGEASGQDVLAAVKRHSPSTVAIMLTGYASLESAITALREGAYDYLIKPSDPEELRVTVRRGVERRTLARALESRVRELEAANRRIAELNTDLERRVDEATADLRAAVERLQELDDLKSQFLSIASHELRGVREKLGASDEPDEQTGDLKRLMRQLTIIHDQSAKLGRLVRELLDVSRIQSGRLEFDFALVDLGDVVKAAVEQAQMTSPSHTYDVRTEGDLTVMGDRDHLEQVISNLVDNAVKYSPDGGPVRVRAARQGESVVVTVEDEGIGIPKEQVARVFDLFFRTHEAEARRTPGLGLGLYITRGIVERHGGRIWAESAKGKGTCVHVTLPVRQTSSGAAQPPHPQAALR